MDGIRTFLRKYGLDPKGVDVYLACLQLGEATVLTLSKRAGTKRPTTYLILENLVQKGLVDSFKTKSGLAYRALHPKKLAMQLSNLQAEYAEVLPEVLGLYHSKEDKPIIGVYEDYDMYDQLADEVREYVESGKEALYFGNSEHFYERPGKVKKWFTVMKNKRSHCREILCGDGKVQAEYMKRVEALGNPHYQVRQLKQPSHTVQTEFGVWGERVVFFSGTGKELFTITVESAKMAATQRAVFDHLWQSLPDSPLSSLT